MLAKKVIEINAEMKIVLITVFDIYDITNDDDDDLNKIKISGIIQNPVKMKELTQKISQEL